MLPNKTSPITVHSRLTERHANSEAEAEADVKADGEQSEPDQRPGT